MASKSITQVDPHNVDTAAEMISALLIELSGGGEIDTSAIRSTTQRLLSDGLVEGLIAHVDKKPAGVLMLNECAAVYAGGRFGEITELYVKPEHRSGGIAALLISEARNHAQKRGWRRLEVGAPDQPTWQRTLQFYLREGFVDVGPRLKLLF